MSGRTGEVRRLWLHVVLFLATLLTTTAAGALQSGADFLSDPRQIVSGLPFAVTLMSILLVHEMGHYLTSRYYGVHATLPYFIPGPTILGTFGAFIRMQSTLPDRRSVFDIGAAGPLAGLALAVPAAAVGLRLSTIIPNAAEASGLSLGSSLLFSFLSKITFGTLPEGADIALHPIATAGWVGLFVTAMNLLPASQLDGGHVAYALFGKKHIWVSRLTAVTLLVLGATRWYGWFVWGLLFLFFGLGHPPALDADTPLDAKRKFVGWFLLATLAVTFMPVPFSVQEPDELEERHRPAPPEPLQKIQGREVLDERAIELASIFSHHHAPGSRALHL
ncbi:MAG TPA: site-2 protease family protein [Candidatus Binatia bacterium]|jgi:membrane-associated protease RseP (regulator of RpoE activity)